MLSKRHLNFDGRAANIWFVRYLFCSPILFLSLFSMVSVRADEPSAPRQTADLVFDVTELRSESGVLQIALYSGSEGFPRDASKAVAKQTIAASGNEHRVVFKNLPAGSYALALHHDENENGKMEFSFIGMPKEGFGFSQNRRVVFGPPSFEEAKVEHSVSSEKYEVRVKYF